MDNINNYDIKTKLLGNILEIRAENNNTLFYNNRYQLKELQKEKKFQNCRQLIQIKEIIDKLLKDNKLSKTLENNSTILKLSSDEQGEENKFTLSLYKTVYHLKNEVSEILNNIKKKSIIPLILVKENEKNTNSNNNEVKKKILCNTLFLEKENITFLSVFPNGNKITGSWDGNLKIYKIFDIKKKYSEYKAHKSCVMYISIKNDNEFASCSDIEIKIFNIKEEGNKFIFEIKLFFDNAHNDVINKILYSKNNNYLFSCSMDNCIKIWDLDNNNENKKIINEDDNIFCFDFLNNEQIIISSGVYGTNIYEIIFNNNPLLVNSNKILNFKEANCLSRFGITKMYDDDKLKEFIVCGNFINIISLNENKIIFTKKFNFTIWDCCFIKDNENEELILIGNDNIVQILSKNQNKYEKGITMNEFKNKNYFRIIDMGKDVFFIFSSCNDLFSFNYSNSQNYENFDETIKIF